MASEVRRVISMEEWHAIQVLKRQGHGKKTIAGEAIRISVLHTRTNQVTLYNPGFLPAGQAHGQCLIEAFNSCFWQECLNEHLFLSLEDLTEKVDAWRFHHNEERLHSGLGYKSPAEHQT